MKPKYFIAGIGFFTFLGLNNAFAANFSGLKVEGDCSIVTTFTVNVAKKPEIGTYLAGPTGMTLYYLENETDNNIKCKNEVCLSKWPIFYEKELSIPRMLKSKDFKVFKRPDGKLQISYDNKPLYYFEGDKKPGDTFGNNLKTPVGIWHIIKVKIPMSQE
ncbi:MAG: COG4315 family predicted lipoprotein [Desulfurella sp.]|uniref:COG4315 family predicted lipoprotein n=1 Tax=Desulfurella sp. TaxID=1962857 RepID=UPI003D0F9159